MGMSIYAALVWGYHFDSDEIDELKTAGLGSIDDVSDDDWDDWELDTAGLDSSWSGALGYEHGTWVGYSLARVYFDAEAIDAGDINPPSKRKQQALRKWWLENVDDEPPEQSLFLVASYSH